jgi:tetratricopeptide (TPR) repeat protein
LHTRGAFWNCIVEKVPLFALAAASSTATIITQQAALSSFTHLPLADRLGNALMSYVVYIREMFWPTNLAVIYPLRPNQFSFWQITAAAGFLAAITVATWLSRKSRPYLFVGWLWYVSILLPVIGIVQVGLQAHADRYTYLPQIGLYIAIAWSVSEFAGRIYYPKAIVAFASVFALVALTSATWAQLSYWREPLALWEHTIAVTSDNDVAHSYLADLLLRNGRIPDAISHAQEAIRLNPVNADAQNNLGLALLQAGDEQDAVIHLEQGLKIDSENANARINLAWILATSSDARLRDGARAVTLAETVVRGRGRDNSTVLRTLAAAYAEAGRFSEAMETAERALQIAKANGESGLATDLQAAIENYRSERTLRSK